MIDISIRTTHNVNFNSKGAKHYQMSCICIVINMFFCHKLYARDIIYNDKWLCIERSVSSFNICTQLVIKIPTDSNARKLVDIVGTRAGVSISTVHVWMDAMMDIRGEGVKRVSSRLKWCRYHVKQNKTYI